MSADLSAEDKKLVEKEEKRLKEEADKDKLKEEADYKKQTDAERKKYFKGTIVVIVIYGLTILGMSVIGIVSPSMREVLFVSGFPFTVTFISGVILVILGLLVQLFAYTPAAMPEKYAGDNLSCPDFWILKKTDPNELKKITDSKVRNLSKYYCENPLVTNDIALPGPIINADATSSRELQNLRIVSDKYKNSTIAENYHMKCNRLYPDYMASIDKQKFPLNPTAMRCEYISQCGIGTGTVPISWTGACPK